MAAHIPIRLSIRTEDQDGKATPVPPLTVVPGLTPPVTPTKGDDAYSSGTMTAGSSRPSSFVSEGETLGDPLGDDTHPVSPTQYSDELEFQYNPRGRPVEFGRGVWSVVYKASSRPSSTSPLMTPPSSPAGGGRVVAVKSPVRRDAHAVLDAEALALTRISRMPGSERHIIPFHGYISESHSIVMSAVPLSLASYIEEKADLAQKHKSTQTMFDPVLGMPQWQELAKKLITGLQWLHMQCHLVHGDIKPHNILLKARPISNDIESDEFPFEPLFADFSSAHNITGSPLSAENSAGTSLTALTPPFAAPELLSVSSLTSPGTCPTPASDVFSLAVTLLAAATGDLLLYPGTSNMQRLAMAREGHRVIDFARSGPNGSRVPRNGPVEQVIKPAVSKDPSQRIQPNAWVELLAAMA
ncbi:kinase-like domain-containing protein [Aspergillus bertholletiae]|uniref:Kinase-like domain-containing protein n=1 Tax=Aspergillus bertholletiae TaxID=1226010 RepID=A0A5N7BMA2_9EURO|nr:kinase-like domain-containing protein [Aspergillus bertholletiae]